MRWPAQAGDRVRKQDWKVDGRRKLAISWKVQPEDSMTDEELEVGPKVKLEDAVFGASRKPILKVERRMQLRGKLAVDPLAQPEDGRPMRVGRRSPEQPGDATPREAGAGRRGSRTIYIRRKLEVDRAGEPRFNIQLHCELFKNEAPEASGSLAFSFLTAASSRRRAA